MHTSPSLTSLDTARAEIERMARAATSPDGARGWWHAARIVRLFNHAARVLKQCAQHARFFSASSPDKAAAYRSAIAIVARHTGESLAAHTVANAETADATFTAAKKKQQKQKSGPGWMGWMEFDTAGSTTENTSPASSSFQPSYPSRSALQRADSLRSASIRFVCG